MKQENTLIRLMVLQKKMEITGQTESIKANYYKILKIFLFVSETKIDIFERQCENVHLN